MNFNNKKECLRSFESRCEMFKTTVSQLQILSINYDEYEHDYKSDALDKNTAEWKNFLSEIKGYFQVNQDSEKENEINNILLMPITMDRLEDLQNIFHEMIIDIDVKKAKEQKMNEEPRLVDRKDTDKNAVFIVHGHDGNLMNEVARFIEKQKLKAIILHEQASSGRTIIENIEEYTNVGFGIVIYTPDDLGKVKDGDSGEYNARARQNVVLEHGYLMGKLGRKRVCAIVKGNIEKPSDIDGVIYIDYESTDGWKLKLAIEMRNAGYSISL